MKLFTLLIFLSLTCVLPTFSLRAQVAGFTSDTSAGCPPLVVSFTNTSTSSTRWNWNFGDGSGIHPGFNVSTSYLASGVYTVTLTAYSGPDSSKYSRVITVYPAPVVNFSYNDTNVCPGAVITFTSTATGSVPGPVINDWYLGDGDTAVGASVNHGFASPGYYNVKLTVINADGCSAFLLRDSAIHIYTPPITVISASDTFICNAPAVVDFLGSVSGSGPFIYRWTFGDLSPQAIISNPAHTYAAPGHYAVKLSVTDVHQCQDSATKLDYVKIGYHAASFLYPDTACTNSPVTFTNTSTTHPTNNWTFGDGHTSFFPNGVNTYVHSGLDTVTLIISDSSCVDTARNVIYIRQLSASFTQAHYPPCPPPVAVTFTASAPPGATVTWNFGDGRSGTGATCTHTYTNRGIDTIHMFVLDPVTGCRDTVMQIDTLYDLLFDIIDTQGSGCVPLTTHFSPTYVTFEPPDTSVPKPYPFGVTSYYWSFGDGFTSTLSDAVHAYSVIGNYWSRLTYTTGNGCVLNDSVPINVGGASTISYSVSPTHVCYDQPVYFVAKPDSGNITEWLWEMGDGESNDISAEDTNVLYAYRYRLPGVFTATLVGVDNGCRGRPYVGTAPIIVDSPKAILEGYSLCPPVTRGQFKDSSMGETSRLWLFGDGDTSTLKNPIHNFPAISSYTVRLIAYNSRTGCRDTAYDYINLGTALHFSTPDTAICPGTTIDINSSITGLPVQTYRWLVDGASGGSTTALFTKTFNTPGYHTITLIVLDENSCLDTLTKTNYILVAKPRAHFNESLPACVGETVILTSTTTDQIGTFFTNYSWTFGDATAASVSTNPTPHIYSFTATFPVQLIVTDNVGCKDTTAGPITVYPVPTAVFLSGTHPCIGVPVPFSNLSYNGATSYSWYFGDGGTSSLPSPSHTYTIPGTYSVMLVAYNSHGCSDTENNVNYTHITPKPVAAFSMADSFSVCPPLNVHFTNSSTGATPLTYYWKFGNGGTSTNPSPTDPIDTTGLFTITLAATDSFGCADTAFGHVTMFGYPGGFSYNKVSGCVPDTVIFTAPTRAIATVEWDFNDGDTAARSYSDTVWHVYRTPGHYIPKLILSDSCTRSSAGLDTIKINGLRQMDSIIAGQVCVGDSVRLYDSTTGGTWTSGTTSLATVGSGSGILTGIVPGTAMISYFVSNVCGVSDTFTVVRVKPLPFAGIISGAAIVCTGDSITLHDTASGGSWMLKKTGVVSVAGGEVTGVTPGTATVAYIISNTCGSDTATKMITVFPLPFPGNITGLRAACVGSIDTLTDTVPGGVWSSINTAVAVVGSSGYATLLGLGSAIITYTTPPNAGGCISSTTFRLLSTSTVSVSGIVSPVSCYGGSDGSITTNESGGIGPYIYLWSVNKYTRDLTSLTPGIYKLEVTDSATRCYGLDSFEVTQPDSLYTTSVLTDDTCREGTGSIVVTVSGGSPPYHLLWSNNAVESEIRSLPGGFYSVAITDSNNCLLNMAYKVGDTCNEIKIHDVITPNGDGINDVWVIEGLQNYPQNTVQIFDKWGTMLYEKTNYNNEWGGKSDNGNQLPDGTYYYLVKLNATNTLGGANVFKGAILIKR